jgi:hypothetical protein
MAFFCIFIKTCLPEELPVNKNFYNFPMKLNFLLFCILIMILIASCKKEDPINFTLYLNFIFYSESATYTDTCLIFKVTIDGNRQFSDSLCNEGVSPCVLIYSFPIEPGLHQIQAEAARVAGQLDTNVYFTHSKKFGYLNYRSETKSFDFYLSTSGGIDK